MNSDDHTTNQIHFTPCDHEIDYLLDRLDEPDKLDEQNASQRVIFAGSRTATKAACLAAWQNVPFYPEIRTILSGTARGADRYGEEIAEAEGLKIERYPANWDKFGRSAGYRRNEEMARKANALIAVWDGQSRGTQHMINLANQAGLRVYVYHIEPAI